MGFYVGLSQKCPKRCKADAERQESPILRSVRTLGYSPGEASFLLKTVRKMRSSRENQL